MTSPDLEDDSPPLPKEVIDVLNQNKLNEQKPSKPIGNLAHIGWLALGFNTLKLVQTTVIIYGISTLMYTITSVVDLFFKHECK